MINNLLDRFITKDLKAHYTPPDNFILKQKLIFGEESLEVDKYVHQTIINNGLHKVYNVNSQGKGLWTREVAIGFLKDKMGLDLKESVYCFAMAKTAVDETSGKHYQSVTFTEFLEIILRASILKYKKVGKDDASLVEKMESACKIAIDSVVNVNK